MKGDREQGTQFDLEEMAYLIRRLSLEMITYSRWGHPGGSLSAADLLAELYFHTLCVDPRQPDWEQRDRFVCSKAHAAPAVYAALALRGFFPVSEIYTYCEIGGRLEGHIHRGRLPGVETSGGPLGIGLSVAVGIALGLRSKELPRPRVVCLLGDGECNEGNVWEAAMAAAHYHLDNLIAVVDYNKVMAKGFTWDLMGVEPFAEKWEGFGWDVLEVDGHSLPDLAQAFHELRWVRPRGRPLALIAHTVKGKGVDLAEFNYKWHTHAPDPETADQMLRALSRAYGRPEEGYTRLGVEHSKETFYGGE